MRALIYVRVSSADQVKGFSLDIQERACIDYCTRNGWDVAGVYREEGESAKTADRPELQRLLARLAKPGHRVTHVVVYDLSRLTRAQYDHVVIGRALEDAGVRLAAVTQHVDATPTGKFTAGVLACVNELDNAIRSEKALSGMKEAFRRGVWPWLPPIGYRSAKHGSRATLEHDPRLAPLVRRAFDRMATGLLTGEELRHEMAGAGLSVSRSAFYGLLRCPVYCGRLVAPKWGLTARGNFEPIVAEDVFDRVQEILSRAPSGWTRSEHVEEFPLRYWTRCIEHERPITAFRSRGRSSSYPYYRCTARPACLNVRRERVDVDFRAFLRRLACPAPVWRFWEETLREEWLARRAAIEHEVRAVAQQIAVLDAREERLLAAFLDQPGAIDGDLFSRQRAKIAGERDKARQALAIVSAMPALEPALATGRRVLEEPESTWDEIAPGQRYRFVRLAFAGRLDYSPAAGFRTAGKSLYQLSLNPENRTVSLEWPTERDGYSTVDAVAVLTTYGAIRELVRTAA